MDFEVGDKVLIIELNGYGEDVVNMSPFVVEIIQDYSNYDIGEYEYRFKKFGLLSAFGQNGTVYFNELDEVELVCPAMEILFSIDSSSNGVEK